MFLIGTQPAYSLPGENRGMGLFAQQPEEPTEWAGLPGEPLRPRTGAELLPEELGTVAAPDALLGFGAAAVASIEVPASHAAAIPDGADGDA